MKAQLVTVAVEANVTARPSRPFPLPGLASWFLRFGHFSFAGARHPIQEAEPHNGMQKPPMLDDPFLSDRVTSQEKILKIARLGLSRAVAYRNWKYARAWLREALEK